MNKEVNFEIAKLLQGKGFDEPCKFGYNGSFEPYHIGLIEFSYLQQNSELLELTYSAPTIAEVVMWLYEKHGIWVSVGGDDNKTFKYELHVWSHYEPEKVLRQGQIQLGDTLFDVYSQAYKTPTEAYEAGIKHVLENLI